MAPNTVVIGIDTDAGTALVHRLVNGELYLAAPGPAGGADPLAWVCWRLDPEHRVVALGLHGIAQALALLCLAVGYREPDWRRWRWRWRRCRAEARSPSRGSWNGGCDGRRAVMASGVISDVLLVAGLVIVVGSCAGMAVFDDPLYRLHLVTPAAMLGSTGICASIDGGTG